MVNDAKKQAIKTCKAMKTNFAGVDIMFDVRTKKAIVIETNAFPGYPASKKFNLSKVLLKDIKENYS